MDQRISYIRKGVELSPELLEGRCGRHRLRPDEGNPLASIGCALRAEPFKFGGPIHIPDIALSGSGGSENLSKLWAYRH